MDVDVACSETVPRYVDVALLLCETALRCLSDVLNTGDGAQATELFAWYMYNVSFLHFLPGDDDGSAPPPHEATKAEELHGESGHIFPGIDGSNTAAASASSRRWAVMDARDPKKEDIDFSAAYRRAGEPQASTAPPLAPESPPSSTAELLLEAVKSRGRGRLSATSPLDHWMEPSEPPTDVGFCLISDFLRHCHRVGGEPLLRHVAAVLCLAIASEGSPSQSVTPLSNRRLPAPSLPSATTRITVTHLSDLLEYSRLDDELGSETGNASHSFHVWVVFEWAMASFHRQSHLAMKVNEWFAALWPLAAGSSPIDSLPRSSHERLGRGAPVEGSVINLKQMQAALVSIFEGHTVSSSRPMELALSPRVSQLSDSVLARLLFLQTQPTAALVHMPDLQHRGTHPIQASITSGMLIYMQYYLSLRSLTVARECVRVALQVAQELQSNDVLALSHYMSYVVYLIEGKPLEAANSIAIALQLASSSAMEYPSTSSSNNGSNGGGGEAASAAAQRLSGPTTSLAALGAAQLLLFYPGMVSATLRSALASAEPPNSPMGSDVASRAAHGQSSGGHGSNHHHGTRSGGPHAAGGAVMVQTIAQSIRHALRRSEMALMPRRRCDGAALEIIAAVSRETLLIIAGLYGVVSAPQRFDVSSVAAMLTTVAAATAVMSPVDQQQPSWALLMEMIRHCAHAALALQEGVLRGVDGDGGSLAPVRVVEDLLQAARTHYGAAGTQLVEKNVFFVLTCRYIGACWLMKEGYMTAAYDAFHIVVEQLVFVAGVDHSGEAAAPEPGGEDAILLRYCSGQTQRNMYWPPDHLLLYAYAQYRRAQAAVFLGRPSALASCQQTLLAVSTRHHFSFGVLVAEMIQALVCQQQCSFSAMLEQSVKVERSAAAIGIVPLQFRAKMLQITALCCSCRWAEAATLLPSLHGVPLTYRPWYYMTKFNASLEKAMAAGRPSQTLEQLCRDWVVWVQEQYFRAAETASCSASVPGPMSEMSIVDQLCLCSSLHRALGILNNDGNAVESSMNEILQRLMSRQSAVVSDVFLYGTPQSISRCILAKAEGQ